MAFKDLMTLTILDLCVVFSPPEISRSQELPHFKHVLRSRNGCIVKLFVHNKHS